MLAEQCVAKDLLKQVVAEQCAILLGGVSQQHSGTVNRGCIDLLSSRLGSDCPDIARYVSEPVISEEWQQE